MLSRQRIGYLLFLLAFLPLIVPALTLPVVGQQATPTISIPVVTPTPTQTPVSMVGGQAETDWITEAWNRFGWGTIALLFLSAAIWLVKKVAEIEGEAWARYVQLVLPWRRWREQRTAQIEADLRAQQEKQAREEAEHLATAAQSQGIPAYLRWLQDKLKELQTIPIDANKRQQQLLLDDVYIPLRVVERSQIEGFRKLTQGSFSPEGETRLREEAFAELKRSQHAYRLLSAPDYLPKTATDDDDDADDEDADGGNAPKEQTTTCLLLVGDAGSGKTTTLHFGARVLAYDCEQHSTQGACDHLELHCGCPLLPIYIRLTLLATYVREKHRHVAPDDLPRLQGAPSDLLLHWLNSYIRAELRAPALPEDFLTRCLSAGNCLLLLDGLDETGDEEMRRYMQDTICDLVENYPHNRFLVASRPFEHLHLPGFTERHLSPLKMDEMALLLNRWFTAVYKSDTASPQVQEQVADKVGYLLDTFERNTRLFDMATNPLLLTSMALLVQTGFGLPRERAEIYNRLVRLLLETWRQQQTRDGILGQQGGDVQLYGEKDNVTSIRQRLQTVAAWMQQHERREIRPEKVAKLLQPTYANEAWAFGAYEDYIHRLLRSLALHSGLLQQRDNGYTFAHYTLQEYLTARAFAARAAGVNELAAYHTVPRWRETLLLAVGHWATSDALEQAQNLLGMLLASYDTDPHDTNALLLAGAALDDTDATKLPDLANACSETARRLHALAFSPPAMNRLPAMNRRATDPHIRNQAAELLDRLNADQRPELDLTAPAYWATPIPPGPFVMGDDNGQYDDEKPAFVCRNITQPYALARFPVTNRQYHQFLTDLERQGRMDEAQQHRPRFWPGARYRAGEGHHPVVGVSWADACAFAAWADQLLRNQGLLGAGDVIRLPTEPEWERAATYPVQVSPDQPGQGKRVYPWGDAWDAPLTSTTETTIIADVRANTRESNIGSTSVVGIFPEGAAECKAEELAGNVWEWCSTPKLKYRLPEQLVPETADRKKEYKDRLYSLRGGSWDDDASLARGVCRFDPPPGLVGVNIGLRLARCSHVLSVFLTLCFHVLLSF